MSKAREGKTYRDRIIGCKKIDPKLLTPHPLNWKVHTDEQRRHFRALLDEVGFAGACLVRPAGKRFQLIAGHMRAEEMQQPVTCLILDVTAREAAELLELLDPSAEMAETDEGVLANLMASFSAETPAFQEAMKALCPLSGEPVFDAGGLLLPTDDSAEQFSDDTVQVPVLFTREQHGRFVEAAAKLNAKYGTDNYSDAVLRACQEWDDAQRKARKAKGRRRAG